MLKLSHLTDIHSTASADSAFPRLIGKWAADARWILPVAPIYRERIVEKTKTVELRRYNTRIEPGDLVLLYESRPVSSITTAIRIGAVEEHCPHRLWDAPGPHRLGVDPEAYRRAFAAAPVVWVHQIASVVELAPIGFVELASRWPGWRPPQRVMRRRPSWQAPAAWLEPAPLEPAPLGPQPEGPVQLLPLSDYTQP